MVFTRIAMFMLQASVFLLVFSIDVRATWQDATSLFRRPGMLARSLLSMNVVMPVFATAVARVFDLRPAIKIALVLLAVSPVPPILPQRQLKAGGSLSYVHGLLTEMSLFSILVVPFAINVLGRIFSQDVHIAPTDVAKVVIKTILLPLSLGILVHWRWPGFAERASAPLGRVANLMLLAAALPLLVIAWRPVMGLIGNGAVLAMAAFCVVGVAVGHWLGGPDPSESTTLALATACRHPGLAIAIAAANFPEQRKLVAAAVVLYLLVSTLLLVPYTTWCKRRLSQSVESQRPQQRAA